MKTQRGMEFWASVLTDIWHNYLDTGEEQFEQVNSFKYLGAMVNTDNSIEEEIKERIAAGNRAYHVHKKLFT